MMPTRKISNDEQIFCRHPEHNPPGMMVFSPGAYEHTCPACKKITVFRVTGTYMTCDSRYAGIAEW